MISIGVVSWSWDSDHLGSGSCNFLSGNRGGLLSKVLCFNLHLNHALLSPSLPEELLVGGALSLIRKGPDFHLRAEFACSTGLIPCENTRLLETGLDPSRVRESRWLRERFTWEDHRLLRQVEWVGNRVVRECLVHPY